MIVYRGFILAWAGEPSYSTISAYRSSFHTTVSPPRAGGCSARTVRRNSAWSCGASKPEAAPGRAVRLSLLTGQRWQRVEARTNP